MIRQIRFWRIPSVCIPRNVRFEINQSKSDTETAIMTSLDRQRQPIARLSKSTNQEGGRSGRKERKQTKRNFRQANRKGEHVFMLYKSDSRRGHKY